MSELGRIYNKAMPNESQPNNGDPWDNVDKLFTSVLSRLNALEMRPLARDGVNGKDADIEMLRRIVAEEVSKVVATAVASQPKRKRITTVTQHDEKGRIIAFEQEDE